MKLLIVGPRGKMGRLITSIAADNKDIEIVGGIGPVGRDYIGKDIGEVAMTGKHIGAPVYDDIEKVIDLCDVIIDFSTVEQGMATLAAAVKHNKALVCGSTGFSPEQRQAFADAASEIPVMLAANTSKMVNVMYKLLAEAAKALDEADIEIVDMHDNTKLDAPSGTAKEIGEIIASAKNKDIEEISRCGRGGRCPRVDGEISYHSLRGGDTPSSHIVYFMGKGERLEIAHHSINWRCFASGAVSCAVFLHKQPKGQYFVEDTVDI